MLLLQTKLVEERIILCCLLNESYVMVYIVSVKCIYGGFAFFTFYKKEELCMIHKGSKKS